MRKKGKYKGVRYIATKVLPVYFKKDYPTYTSSLPKARELLLELKRTNSKVTISTVTNLVRATASKKSKVPDIGKKLLEPSHYFELVDYPVWIARCSNDVWFKSKLVPSDKPDIQGGLLVDYNDYFNPYVSYINSISKHSASEDKRYETDWNVVCTVPVYNRYKKRWESNIVSVDGRGDSFDYGFNPKKPFEKSDSLIVSHAEVPPAVMPQGKEDTVAGTKGPVKTVQDEKIIIAQTKKIEAESEKLRQENISALLKMFGKGELTKQEFKEMMNNLK